MGTAGAKFLEKAPLNKDEIKQKLQMIKDDGISSISVVLAHSYACPQHELEIGVIAKELGQFVSYSDY